MKYFLFFLILPLQLFSQKADPESKALTQAREMLAVGDALKALEMLQAQPPSARLNVAIAQALLSIRARRTEALPLLEQAIANGADSLTGEYAALLLHLGTPQRALQALESAGLASSLMGNHCVNAIRAMARPVASWPVWLSQSSEYADHTPVVSVNDSALYFTSRRPVWPNGVLDGRGEYDENILESRLTATGWSTPTLLEGNINTARNEATVSMDWNEPTMYVFRSTDDGASGDVWEAGYGNRGWQFSLALPEPINTQWIEHSATAEPEGNVVIVSSDRPGGYGGFDLWRVVRFGNGRWSEAENLGPHINTAADEVSPYLMPDANQFYFASNGERSMGGYDLFEASLTGNRAPENLGYPINTCGDNLHLFVHWRGGSGYYTSQSPSRPDDVDVFRTNLPGFNMEADVHLIAIEPAEAADGAEVSLFTDDYSTIMGIYTPSTEGRCAVVLMAGESGVFEVRAAGCDVFEMPLTYGEQGVEAPVVHTIKLTCP